MSERKPIGLTVPYRKVEKPFDDDDIQDYKKPWVGLTGEEQQELYDAWIQEDDGWGTFYRLIEAKLKEKNHG